MENIKYYLVYQIENKLNGMIYIGCHVTTNIKDKYMGSGTNIRKAIKQYGLENFDKSILHCFDNEKEMLDKEAELVNKEFIADSNTYNICIGGNQFLSVDCITVKDKNGNNLMVHKNDPRYLSGELVGVNKGKTTVKDKYNNFLSIDINDPKYLSGELIHNMINMVCVRTSDGKNMIISKNNEKYLSGEYKFLWKDKKHSNESKLKMSEKAKLRTGDKNSSFGTCWITKDNENKKIKKEDLNQYINDGWFKGRKIKGK